MPFVSDFESSSVQEKNAVKVEQRFDYAQVETALKVDKGTAETAFARCAKHHFRGRLGSSVKMVMPEEVVFPVWYSYVSLTVDLGESPKGYVNTVPLQLYSLTEALIATVLSTQGSGKEVRLVGALTTGLGEVGPNLFSFTLKQKWGYANE
jgi:hypothetical protein